MGNVAQLLFLFGGFFVFFLGFGVERGEQFLFRRVVCGFCCDLRVFFVERCAGACKSQSWTVPRGRAFAG